MTRHLCHDELAVPPPRTELATPEPPAHPRARTPLGVVPENVRTVGGRPIGSRSASLTPLKVLVVTLVVLQRFVVPGTPVSLALPVAFGVCAVLLIRGHARLDPLRTAMWMVAVLTCGTAALISTLSSGRTLSVSSLGLLAVVYMPLCIRVAGPLRGRLPELLEFLQRLMVPAALVCIGQWVAQMVGWQFTDLLAWVPSSLLVPREAFNLSYPLYYGSSIFKSNGIVFLEASFASQFLALAILVQILLGGRMWRILLFAAALLCTFAGTGMVLLGVGLAVIALRRGGRWAFRAGVVAGIAICVVALTPAGSLISDRASEPAAEGSSGNARFVAPYSLVSAALSSDPPEIVVGRGPGSVDRDVDFFNPHRIEVSYPAVPKLVGEYGLPAALVFLTFVGAVLVRRPPSPVLATLAVVLYLVLSSALLQPLIVILTWMITGLFATAPAAAARPVLVVRRVVGRVR